MLRSVFILLFLILSGCSWFSSSKKEVEVGYAPRIINSIAAPKPILREPGSLWSEDSKWNDIYSPTQARYPGDVIQIQMGPGLKSKILAMAATVQKEKPKENNEENITVDPKAKTTTKNEPKAEPVESTKKEANTSTQSSQNDTKKIEATILEVMPRGIYRVSANRGVRVGDQDPYVSLQASVREKEIASDETVSSDSLFNIQMEIIKPELVKSGG